MSELRIESNVWSGAAVALVAVALVALGSVLSGPYASSDSKILYTLGASLLGGSTFFAALTLVERGAPLLGFAAAIASVPGFVLLTYALWQEPASSSEGEGPFWTGTVTLLAALIATTARLLARADLTRWIAAAAGVCAVLAALVSIDAALSDEQFWRVGTRITVVWTLATLLLFLVPVFERAITESRVWLGAAIALAGAALVGIGELPGGEFAPKGYSIFFTLIAAVSASGTFLGGVVILERHARVLGWTAIALSPIALATISDGIWNESDDRFQLIATGAVVVISLYIALAARLFAHRPAIVRLAAASAVSSATAAVISVEGIWRDERFFFGEKTTTALWILATLCSLLVPVLERHRVDSTPRVAEAA